MACQIQSSQGDKSAWWAEFGCWVSGQSLLSKVQKAAENHVSDWWDGGRSECLVLNPEHLHQKPLPANAAVDNELERLGGKETCLPAIKEFLSSNWCWRARKSPPAKLLSPAARCAACCAASLHLHPLYGVADVRRSRQMSYLLR